MDKDENPGASGPTRIGDRGRKQNSEIQRDTLSPNQRKTERKILPDQNRNNVNLDKCSASSATNMFQENQNRGAIPKTTSSLNNKPRQDKKSISSKQHNAEHKPLPDRNRNKEIPRQTLTSPPLSRPQDNKNRGAIQKTTAPLNNKPRQDKKSLSSKQHNAEHKPIKDQNRNKENTGQNLTSSPLSTSQENTNRGAIPKTTAPLINKPRHDKKSLSSKQGKVEHKPFPDQNRNKENTGQNLTSSPLSTSQENKNRGAIPKTKAPLHNTPRQEKKSLSSKQGKAEHKPFPDQNRNKENTGQNFTSSPLSTSQENKNRGAIPKTTASPNNKPKQDKTSLSSKERAAEPQPLPDQIRNKVNPRQSLTSPPLTSSQENNNRGAILKTTTFPRNKPRQDKKSLFSKQRNAEHKPFPDQTRNKDTRGQILTSQLSSSQENKNRGIIQKTTASPRNEVNPRQRSEENNNRGAIPKTTTFPSNKPRQDKKSLSYKQRKAKHQPLPDQNRNKVSPGQNLTSPLQEDKTRGAIPKTTAYLNNKPTQDNNSPPSKQRKAEHKPLLDRNRHKVNSGQSFTSPQLNRPQDGNNLGTINSRPTQNEKPHNQKRFGRRNTDSRRFPGRRTKTDTKHFGKQGSSVAYRQERSNIRNRKHSSSLGFRYLNELSKSDVDERELSLTLISSKSGFDQLLNQDTIQPDWMQLILSIIVKACRSTCNEYVLQLLNIVSQSKFLEYHITAGFLLKFQHTYLQEQMDLVHSIDNIIVILGEILTKLPTFADKCKMVTIILDTIPDKLTALDPDDIDVLKLNIISINKRTTDILSTNVRDDKMSATHLRKHAGPPNDYREMSICPTNEDIHMEGQAYVRPNKSTGKFDDHNHYLDVQFRLLREDYIQPLREGIKEYLHNVSAGKPKAKLTDARMYNDVKIICPKCTPDGIVYSIQFDTTPFRHIRWDASKRLIFGSLVCLSRDNFDTFLVAVVIGREVNDMQQGFVDIRFTEYFDMGGEEMKKVFVMLETTAYFEAYKHVLEGLQEFTDRIPFQRYIVSCNTEVRPPLYLFRQPPPKYDLSWCLKENASRSQQVYASAVSVLKTSQWPSNEALCFDQSQLQAVKTALTKEFAIIQGPPGTGKTYVGLKIARVLLENKAAWGARSPILVVCYTNHALDQFLEGMLDFGAEGLIRVGGRSINEKLQKHTLKEKRLSFKKNRDYRKEVVDVTSDCWQEMKTLEETMLHDSVKLEFSAKGVLSEKALRSYMTEEQFESFNVESRRAFRRHRQFSSMGIWLNLGSETYGQPGEGFGESYLFSLTPNHIWILAYKLQLEAGSLETVQYYEQMAETLEHQLKYDRGNMGRRWQKYRQWKGRFEQHQNTELTRAQKRLNSLDTKTRPVNHERGERSHTNLTAKEVKEVHHLQEQVTGINETLQQLNIGILRASCIQAVLPAENKAELDDLGAQIDEYSIARWLGYTEVIQVLLKLQASGEENDSDDLGLIEVEEEASNITNHRLLDDDDAAFSLFKSHREQHEEARKSVVKELAVSLNNTNHHPKQIGEWQIVRPSKKKLRQKIKQILRFSGKMTEDEATRLGNVWDINVNDRHRLYRYWLDVYRNSLVDKIKGFVEEFEVVTKRLKVLREEKYFDILRTAEVIGITTTGAARYRSLLQRVKPKIIIVEEAAEVLESHIISSLNSSCQHLILIGDHKQLRPSPAVYELAKQYKLDISLFERMVNNRVRCDTLQLQHRMRPEIAEILTFIYPELQNHPSVESFEHVKGVSSDIFFLDHENPEKTVEDTKSRSNHQEALFVTALCHYLLLQGYEPSQITVLTTYAGQVFEIKKNMPIHIYDGVRVTAVDNYQGEENDIIILSLVRSNAVGSIGFLNVDNRVCVALSRAKKGLFVIGNFTLLADKSPLWSKIVLYLKSKGFCGPVLELYCQNHPATERLKVKTHKDFEGAPDGGCLKPCLSRLECGHQCEMYCHVLDPDHKEYQCLKKCVKKCEDGHKCRKLCYQPCGDCKVLVTKSLPQCNHEQKVPCHQDPSTFNCQAVCPEILSCNHPCAAKCSEEHTTKCQVSVTGMWPCNHLVTAACCRSPNETPCPIKCRASLDCGHQCGGSCGSCCQGRLHQTCQQKCDRTLVCGHYCGLHPCTMPCPPCSHICNNRCTHSQCEKKCGEKCARCTEPCLWKCDHFKCTELCGEICNRPPCDHNCTKSLPCGHKCIGLCGEPCPKLCGICDKEKVCEIFFGEEDEEGARFVMLEDCGHVLEVKGMDQWMMNKNNADGSIQMKACPKCTVVVRTSLRYGNYIKKTLQDIETVKLKIRGDKDTIKLEKSRLKLSICRSGLDYCTSRKLMERLCTDLSLLQVNVIDNQISLLGLIGSLHNNIVKEKSQLKMDDVSDLMKSIEVIDNRVKSLENFVSNQQLKQFKFESLRICFLFKLLLFQNKLANASQTLIDNHDAALKDIRGNKAFTKEKETYMRSLVDRLKKVAPLGISDSERLMIVQAMDLSRGHWFKCPKGHVYAIGDCGGAMQVSKCPECDAEIGGTNHRLRPDNQLATEMDGAKHAAWSDQANIENYLLDDPDDLDDDYEGLDDD